MPDPRIRRIALFLPSLSGGGAERSFLNLAGALVARGIAVDLVLATPKGALEGATLIDQIPPGVRLVDLAASRIAFSLPSLIRYLRRSRPDVLISALAGTNCVAVLARMAARSIRLVLTEHSLASLAARENRMRKLGLAYWLMPLLYPRADALVGVSKGVTEELVAIAGRAADRVTMLPNPIVTDAMLESSRLPLSHPWFAPGAPPVVLATGRLAPVKDHATLIRAFAVLRKTRPCRLMILGEGNERQALQTLIEELNLTADVILPGFTANPYQYMRAAAVFALSSRIEGHSNALIEAMACGAEIVATDCPCGPREILAGGQHGRLVPVGDVANLAEALGAALAEDRQRAYDVEAYRAENSADAYLRLLVRIC